MVCLDPLQQDRGLRGGRQVLIWHITTLEGERERRGESFNYSSKKHTTDHNQKIQQAEDLSITAQGYGGLNKQIILFSFFKKKGRVTNLHQVLLHVVGDQLHNLLLTLQPLWKGVSLELKVQIISQRVVDDPERETKRGKMLGHGKLIKKLNLYLNMTQAVVMVDWRDECPLWSWRTLNVNVRRTSQNVY